MSTAILTAAQAAYAAGLCLLPTAEDGSKRPAVASWGTYQTTRPTREQMRAWDFAMRDGFGVVGGAVSGHLDPWDFDDADTFNAFIEAAAACGLDDVVDRIRHGFEAETPSGGRRWLVRYPDDQAFRDVALAR